MTFHFSIKNKITSSFINIYMVSGYHGNLLWRNRSQLSPFLLCYWQRTPSIQSNLYIPVYSYFIFIIFYLFLQESYMPSNNHVRLVRLFLKHVHYFVNSADPEPVSSPYQTAESSPLDEFKRYHWPIWVFFSDMNIKETLHSYQVNIITCLCIFLNINYIISYPLSLLVLCTFKFTKGRQMLYEFSVHNYS